MKYDILVIPTGALHTGWISTNCIMVLEPEPAEDNALIGKIYRFIDNLIDIEKLSGKFIIEKENGKYDTYEEAKLVFELL